MAYELLPLTLSPERAEIISMLMRRVASHDTVFAKASCETRCIAIDRTLPEMCEDCRERMRAVASVLSRGDVRAWEVWDETPTLVGVIYFTEIMPGVDAKAHYVFFDSHSLRSKTGVMREAIEWVFTDHEEEGWKALARLTIEIPRPFVALAKHASKALGFGGFFRYTVRERVSGDGTRKRETLMVEGVKRAAAPRDGALVDVLVLGLLRPDASTPPRSE